MERISLNSGNGDGKGAILGFLSLQVTETQLTLAQVERGTTGLYTWEGSFEIVLLQS